MAIYHLEAKVVSRGTGRSAVAAAAYLSCSKILNDYDGIQHDYTRKKGLVWQEVFLPEFAPSEWKERSVLWNTVEENEKTKDSRLAREFVVALPIELNETQWEKLLSDFISGTFVDDGMCADVAIHDPYPPGDVYKRQDTLLRSHSDLSFLLRSSSFWRLKHPTCEYAPAEHFSKLSSPCLVLCYRLVHKQSQPPYDE